MKITLGATIINPSKIDGMSNVSQLLQGIPFLVGKSTRDLKDISGGSEQFGQFGVFIVKPCTLEI